MYKEEQLDPEKDNGTMPQSLNNLKENVIGHKIVKVSQDNVKGPWGYSEPATVLELDNGKKVQMIYKFDCCARTQVENFALDLEMIDHIIMGVGTTENYTEWHIYCDYGDILKMQVDWTCGNPFYYGYGFHIQVEEIN